MDDDLKDILSYGVGTLFGYSAFFGVLYQFITKDANLIVIYTLLLAIFIWLFYIRTKLSKIRKEDKKDVKK